MTRPIITIAGVSREMNDDEFAQYELDQKFALEMKLEMEKRKSVKAELLSKLGITEDEAKLLLS